MSKLLEQLAGSARRAECAKHDAAIAEPERFTCWGLSSFCAEDGHKCRAAGKCVYTPPSTAMRAFFAECQQDAADIVRGVKP